MEKRKPGRPKGSKNKALVRKGVIHTRVPSWEAMKVVANGGQSPLQYMLAVVNDPNADPARRDRMASAAAPYCHPRLSDSKAGKKDMAIAAAHEAVSEGWEGDLAFEGAPN